MWGLELKAWGALALRVSGGGGAWLSGCFVEIHEVTPQTLNVKPCKVLNGGP